MAKPPICRVRLGGVTPHLSQAAAGFTLLHQQGLLRLRTEGFACVGSYDHENILEAELDGGIVLAYDLADGYEDILRKEEFDARLDRLTRYFKRGYNLLFHNEMRNRWKVRPLGLNYAVTCRGSLMDRLRPGMVRAVAEDYMSHNSYPEYKGLFTARLWDPAIIQAEAIRKRHPYLSEEEASGVAARTVDDIERVNRLRVDIIRLCRAELGPRFLGGLEASAYARQRAPELVLPPGETRRDVFLQRLKENYVCVATEGLHHSVGWKMAEYTAAGRAILTDPLRCGLPGEFMPWQNYTEYKTAEECAQRLGELLGNVPRVHRMEAANFAYYNMYVRPDAMILRTLRDGAPELFPWGEG